MCNGSSDCTVSIHLTGHHTSPDARLQNTSDSRTTRRRVFSYADTAWSVGCMFLPAQSSTGEHSSTALEMTGMNAPAPVGKAARGGVQPYTKRPLCCAHLISRSSYTWLLSGGCQQQAHTWQGCQNLLSVSVVSTASCRGGFLVRPLVIEFWQGRPSRLHDRLRYTRSSTDSSDWKLERLYP